MRRKKSPEVCSRQPGGGGDLHVASLGDGAFPV